MNIDASSAQFDVVVVGGSYAGLSAALQLARARREVLVIDAGMRRNRFAVASHGFLGQDGRSPDAIAADGRAQLMAYPSVRWLNRTAAQAEQVKEGFAVDVEGGERVHARRLILATGVVDDLAEIEGLAQRWGRSVFHCPYCHGYELNKGRIGVLAVGPASIHHALMLPDWGEVTLFTNEVFSPDEQQLAAMTARGVVIERERVARIVEKATVELVSGRRIEVDGLFTASRTRVATAIPQQLGCAFEDGPLGQFVRTDALKETTVSGVFACGDAARGAGNVPFAVGDGAQAGVSAHRSLIFS